MTKTASDQILFRAPPGLMKPFREAAARHNRSLADELRIAVEVHVTASLMVMMADPEIKAKLGSEASEYMKQLKDDLVALRRRAYQPDSANLARVVHAIS